MCGFCLVDEVGRCCNVGIHECSLRHSRLRDYIPFLMWHTWLWHAWLWHTLLWHTLLHLNILRRDNLHLLLWDSILWNDCDLSLWNRWNVIRLHWHCNCIDLLILGDLILIMWKEPHRSRLDWILSHARILDTWLRDGDGLHLSRLDLTWLKSTSWERSLHPKTKMSI